MSDAAVKHVKACTHPKVKTSIRAFFEAIADRIPEGQTTTPPLTLDELATASHQVERTARTNRDFLTDIGEIKVHDGGRGRKEARYEMLQLTSGERPIAPAPLPLRADLRTAKPRRRTKEQRSTPDLFADTGEQTSDPMLKRSDLFADVCRKVGSFCRRLVSKVGSDVEKVGSFCRRLLPLDGTRAHATYNNLKISTTTTTAAPPTDPPRPRLVESPPCRWRGKSHAWCDGRVHVPMLFHREELRKLARHPGETDADRDARLFTRYAEALAAIPDTEDLPEETEFDFWKRVLRFSKARAPTPNPRAAPDADLYARARAERQQRQGSGFS